MFQRPLPIRGGYLQVSVDPMPTDRIVDRDQDLTRLKVRNGPVEMVPVGTVADMKQTTIPYRVTRYNLYPAAEVQGVSCFHPA